MRKLVIEIVPNQATREEFTPMLGQLEQLEVLETLRVDLSEGTCVDLVAIRFIDDTVPSSGTRLGHYEVIHVLSVQEGTHTCLVRYQAEDAAQMKADNIDFIAARPTILSLDRFTVSVIGDQSSLAKFVAGMKQSGEVLNLSFSNATYDGNTIIEMLTERQREVLITAGNAGYYDYPRKLNSEQLASKLGISKATTVEHLRKAESRVMEAILTGWSADP